MNDERQAVVTEAQSWIGTPFHHEARVKHAGVDCAQLLYAVFTSQLLIPSFQIAHYPQDWHLHQDGERYLEHLLQYADEMPADRTPLPGDIAIWRFGRCFSHAAIVVAWPAIIHAYVGKTVNQDNLDECGWLKWIWENDVENQGKLRPYRVFSLKQWNW